MFRILIEAHPILQQWMKLEEHTRFSVLRNVPFILSLIKTSYYLCVCLSVCPFKLLTQFTDFYETWHKQYSIGADLKIILLISYTRQ